MDQERENEQNHITNITKQQEPESEDKLLNQEAAKAFEKTVSELESRDGWAKLDTPKISEEDLLKVSKKSGLDEDNQTRQIIKFLTIGSNFACAPLKEKLNLIPIITKESKILIEEIKKELKDLDNMATAYEDIINLFKKIVDGIKHNFNMVMIDLEDSVMHIKILKDASKNEELNDADKIDCGLALSGISKVIKNLQESTKDATKEGKLLDEKIEKLREQAVNKQFVVNRRISFNQVMPICGSIIGSFGNYKMTGLAIQGALFGGPGNLVIAGFACHPIVSIVLTSVLGGAALGSIFYLIKTLWDRHQINTLKKLEDLLSHLNKLQIANDKFMNYMNKSKEETKKILTNIPSIEKSVINGSKRYRNNLSDLCDTVIKSTESIIEMIGEINKLDISLRTSCSTATVVSKKKALSW